MTERAQLGTSWTSVIVGWFVALGVSLVLSAIVSAIVGAIFSACYSRSLAGLWEGRAGPASAGVDRKVALPGSGHGVAVAWSTRQVPDRFP